MGRLALCGRVHEPLLSHCLSRDSRAVPDTDLLDGLNSNAGMTDGADCILPNQDQY